MDVPECNVCNLPLDEDEHQPRHLGCSHDACTACVKELIKNGAIECPMCRRVIRASKAEDLPINHGVVQILRLFKGFMISEKRPKEEGASANTKEICRIHEHTADKRCVSCKLWICVQCQEFHTPDIGCKIQEYKAFIMNTKNDHKDKVEPTLLSIRKDLKSLSSELSDLASEKGRIEERIEKLEKAVENGTMTLNKFASAAANVEKASTSMDLNESVNISNEWYQVAQIWRKKNIEQSSSLLMKLKSDQTVYTSMEIKGESNYGKVMFLDEHMYLHCFRVNGSNNMKSLNVFRYEAIQTLFPSVCDLVFLDLAICGAMKGRVTIRLRQDLPSYAKNIPLMFTGEEGHSLINLNGFIACDFDLRINVSTITKTMNKSTHYGKAGSIAVKGSIIADWPNSNLECFYIYHGQESQLYHNGCEVFGQVETGLDIVKLCRKHGNQSEVTVIDCGLVIKEELLKGN